MADPLFGQVDERYAQPPLPQKTAAGQTGAAGEERVKEPPSPRIEIRPMRHVEGQGPRLAIELRDAEIADVFRVLAHDFQLNLLADKAVRGKLTASFTDISLQEAMEAIAAANHLTLKRRGNIVTLAPNLVTKTFILKHVQAESLLGVQRGGQGTGTAGPVSGYGTGGVSTTGTPAGGSAANTPHTLYDLLSQDGKVLLGQQPNSIMVIDYPDHLAKIEEFLRMADQRMTSKVFRLKYLNAAELVGQAPAGSAQTQTATGTSGSGAY